MLNMIYTHNKKCMETWNHVYNFHHKDFHNIETRSWEYDTTSDIFLLVEHKVKGDKGRYDWATFGYTL